MSTKPRNSLKILFADDEPSLRELMKNELARMGHQVTVKPDGRTALAALEESSFDCLLVDLDMPGMHGIEVITKAKSLVPDLECVVWTGKSSVGTAVDAMKQGAFDYLAKPFSIKAMEAVFERIAEKRRLAHKCKLLERRLERLEGSPNLVGSTPAMQGVKALIDKVAPTPSTVLIRGETGTGKELVARAIHQQSPRAKMPFVPINCGALPETLIESELFGHKRGSFTGADDHRAGLFEMASGGTLFLDEVGELPRSMQAKLLRVLEAREIRRIGDNEPIPIDVRVVCATHRDLEEMVESGDFREDLLFRINPFEIRVPPLRERSEDIPELVSSLLKRFGRHVPRGELDPALVRTLRSHVWPGNVRELANVIEHAVILSGGEPISEAHLPQNLASRKLRGPHYMQKIGPTTLRDLEMQAIQQALDRLGGNKVKAAEELGISLKTLYNRINQTPELEKSGKGPGE